jgi:hypothetical protein
MLAPGRGSIVLSSSLRSRLTAFSRYMLQRADVLALQEAFDEFVYGSRPSRSQPWRQNKHALPGNNGHLDWLDGWRRQPPIYEESASLLRQHADHHSRRPDQPQATGLYRARCHHETVRLTGHAEWDRSIAK